MIKLIDFIIRLITKNKRYEPTTLKTYGKRRT